jgi:hypothetical protein
MIAVDGYFGSLVVLDEYCHGGWRQQPATAAGKRPCRRRRRRKAAEDDNDDVVVVPYLYSKTSTQFVSS